MVEVCVFRFVESRPEYLVLRRSPDEKVYPNLWQIVTGTIGEGERAIDAAFRECKEETSLAPHQFWVVPHVSTFYDYHTDTMVMAPQFAAQVELGDEPTLSPEHVTYRWLGYDEARRRLVWPGHRDCLDIVHTYLVGGGEAAKLALISL